MKSSLIHTNQTGYSLPTKNILKSSLTVLEFNEQIDLIFKWAKNNQSRIVCLANVHMLMEAYWSKEFNKILNTADLVCTDGMPLVWLLKFSGFLNQQRVAGMDLFLKICEIASQSQTSIYFLGSEYSVLQKIRKRLNLQFPTLQIAGIESLPFSKQIEIDSEDLVARINESKAGIVFVCLGCPKQEYWMAAYRSKIQAVMIGVGAVFAIYAGIRSWAPLWVRQWGFEWLYRLIQEPNRLALRYAKTIPPFIGLALLYIVRQAYLLPFLKATKLNFIARYVANIEDRHFQIKSPRIGEILIANRLLDETQLLTALEEQKRNSDKKIGKILIEKQFISDELLHHYLNYQINPVY